MNHPCDRRTDGRTDGIAIAYARLQHNAVARNKRASATHHYVLLLFQLLPLFVMTMFGSSRGFAGLFLATLYGGALRSDALLVLYLVSLLVTRLVYDHRLSKNYIEMIEL